MKIQRGWTETERLASGKDLSVRSVELELNFLSLIIAAITLEALLYKRKHLVNAKLQFPSGISLKYF